MCYAHEDTYLYTNVCIYIASRPVTAVLDDELEHIHISTYNLAMIYNIYILEAKLYGLVRRIKTSVIKPHSYEIIKNGLGV